MSYEEAKKALTDLYMFFDRSDFFGLTYKESSEEMDKRESVKRILNEVKEDLIIEGLLKRGKFEPTEKTKKTWALIEAISEYSEELFGEFFGEDVRFYMTLMELGSMYHHGIPLSDDFLKNPRFLKVFEQKLKCYL